MPVAAKRVRTLIGVDTETTGVDLYHGAKPFFVSLAVPQDGEYVNQWWEWDVDPLTREPIVPPGELEEVRQALADNDLLLQNSTFDAAALATLGITDWPWHRTDDTLLASHILASNQPHDLTSLALHYLGVDILPYEMALKQAVTEARTLARNKFPEWQLAKEGLPIMPSAKGGNKAKESKGAEGSSPWKFDMWLPRAIAKELKYPADHPWWTVTSTYSNTDTAVLPAMWSVMKSQLERRKLWAIYKERLKVLPIANGMKKVGITLSKERLGKLTIDYAVESEKQANTCISIAAKRGYDLMLPKGGVNNSLRQFVFDVLKLEPVYNPKARGDGPSLDKGAIGHYLETLPDGSDERQFVEALVAKRSRDTALTYMEGYKKFWISLGIFNERGEQLWYRLHPSLNPTGTDTLRWSSSNPNEQNISKKEGFNLRYCFGPAPGREWWSCDAKNIELRLPAYESGEQELIALFEKPDEPPYYGSTHLLNFHTVYPDLWEQELAAVGFEKVGPHCKKKYAATWYQWCKNGGFAVQYGAIERPDGWGTADRAFHKRGAHKLLKSRFSKLEAHNQRCIQHAERYGYVETMPDRTVDPARGYPLMCTRTEYGKILPTVPLNYRTQGTAMWWTMKAMIRCHPQLEAWSKADPRGYYLIMQVHDELVFDFPNGTGKEPWRTNLPKMRKIRMLMEEGGRDIGVPTPVSTEYHPVSWSEGITV